MGLIAGMGAIGCAGLLGYVGLLLPKSSSPETFMVAAATGDWSSPQGQLTPVRDGNATFWREGQFKDLTLMIGDSNMEQYFPRTQRLLQEHQVDTSIVFAVSGGCAPIVHVSSPQHLHCPDFVRQAFEFATRSDVRNVAVGAQWFGYFASGAYVFETEHGGAALNTSVGTEAALSAMQTELAHLVSLGKKVYLILNIPIGSEFAPKFRIRRSAWGLVLLIPPTAPAEEKLLALYGKIRNRLSQVGQAAGAVVIDPLDYLCHDGRCPSALANGDPIFKDGYHLRASYVRDHVSYIDRIFDATDAADANHERRR
jgi:hypothetical protein